MNYRKKSNDLKKVLILNIFKTIINQQSMLITYISSVHVAFISTTYT